MTKWTVVVLLAVLLLGGCGSGEAERVSAAATAVDTPLRDHWSPWYAGLGPDQDRLVVYRKPDARLEAFVRERAGDVDIEFRDAPYSLAELAPLAERVNQDGPYWRGQDLPVTSAYPRPDGTGVAVVVGADDLDAARAAFRQRYGDQPIHVDRPARGGIVPA